MKMLTTRHQQDVWRRVQQVIASRNYICTVIEDSEKEKRKIRLRERDRLSLKPYPKSYRDRVIANYASKGLTVSQRMLDELDGKRDPQTPPLFRRY